MSESANGVEQREEQAELEETGGVEVSPTKMVIINPSHISHITCRGSRFAAIR